MEGFPFGGNFLSSNIKQRTTRFTFMRAHSRSTKSNELQISGWQQLLDLRHCNFEKDARGMRSPRQKYALPCSSTVRTATPCDRKGERATFTKLSKPNEPGKHLKSPRKTKNNSNSGAIVEKLRPPVGVAPKRWSVSHSLKFAVLVHNPKIEDHLISSAAPFAAVSIWLKIHNANCTHLGQFVALQS